MRAADLEWIDLVDLGSQKDWQPPEVNRLSEPSAGRCLLVWPNGDTQQIPRIVVKNGELESLFAWVSTYAAHLIPLSANYAVLDWHAVEEGELVPKPRILDPATLRGALGVVHAEATAACGGVPPTWAGLTPFLSTCSWGMFQNLRTSTGIVGEAELSRRWVESRDLLHAVRVDYDLERIQEVWKTIRASLLGTHETTSQPSMPDFLASVRKGTPRPEMLGIPGAEDLVRTLKAGPLERRVEVFMSYMKELAGRRTRSAQELILAGFALTLISQGSFRHIALVGPNVVADVRPLLWYGWFDFATATESAAVNTRSIDLRLLQRSQAGRDTVPVDVGLEELRVLRRAGEALGEAAVDVRHPVTVRLSPWVDALVQPRLRTKAKDHGARQGVLF